MTHCRFDCLFISLGVYKILSSTSITEGAGLDPLRAQKVDPPDNPAMEAANPQLVSVVTPNLVLSGSFIVSLTLLARCREEFRILVHGNKSKP